MVAVGRGGIRGRVFRDTRFQSELVQIEQRHGLTVVGRVSGRIEGQSHDSQGSIHGYGGRPVTLTSDKHDPPG